ncbi:MAG: hypothetical protein LC781_11425 [Actinobacteria bacterium]|nr:hypothetical protein [Actinomycetota bacterium]
MVMRLEHISHRTEGFTPALRLGLHPLPQPRRWDAYDHLYWLARCLTGADDFIRYQHFGEGAYEENEEEIQEFLSERDEISS